MDARVDTRRVQFNLMCDFHAFDSIHALYIRESFKNVGIFPFQSTFTDLFLGFKQSVLEYEAHRAVRVSCSGPAHRVRAVQ